MSQFVRGRGGPRASRRAPRALPPALTFLPLAAASAHAPQAAAPFSGSLLGRAPAGRAPSARGGSARQTGEEEVVKPSHDDAQPRGLFALGALTYRAGPRLAFDAGLRFGLNPEAPRAGPTVGPGGSRKWC